MKKRKVYTLKWTTAAFIFLCCGLFLFANISEVFRLKTGEDIDMIHSIYSLEDNEIDVLFLGSSHGFFAADPNYLWHEYGIASYNMCSHGQSVPSSYYLLKEALKTQSPKIVFLETYTFCDNKLYRGEPRLRQAFDGIHLDDVKSEMIEDFFDDASLSEKLTYYIPFLKYHSRWSELENYDFHSKDFLKGFMMSTTIKPQEAPEIPDSTSELGETACAYFEKIQELCDENNIQLIVFSTPFGISTTDKHYIYRQGINNTLETYLAEKNIPFLYFQKTNMAGIDFATDFVDTHHLNTYGAEKITHYIGDYLVQNFQITDHRGEDSYQSWDEDYIKYQKEFEALEALSNNQ